MLFSRFFGTLTLALTFKVAAYDDDALVRRHLQTFKPPAQKPFPTQRELNFRALLDCILVKLSPHAAYEQASAEYNTLRDALAELDRTGDISLLTVSRLAPLTAKLNVTREDIANAQSSAPRLPFQSWFREPCRH